MATNAGLGYARETMPPEFTHSSGPYAFVLAWLWIASLGVPMPEDIALLTGGYFCYDGSAKIWIMVPVAICGVLSGDLFIFYLGRRWAENLFEHRLVRWIAKPGRIQAIKHRFLEHQIKTVFVGRFLPGMRALVFLTAGAAHMQLWKFLAVNGFAAIISVPAFVGLGYLFGASFVEIKHRVTEVKHVVALVVGGGIIVYLCWLTWSKWAKAKEQRLLTDEPEDKEESMALESPPADDVEGQDDTTSEPVGSVKDSRKPLAPRDRSPEA